MSKKKKLKIPSKVSPRNNHRYFSEAARKGDLKGGKSPSRT